MSSPEAKATCWTLIQAVRAGDDEARKRFVERYLPPVQAYLRARWKAGPLQDESEDAAQEVFLRCFSQAGPLERLSHEAESGFRGFLFGITRNVAREHEKERGRRPALEQGIDELHGEDHLSTLFDRQFARQVVKEARARFTERMQAGDERSQARLRLLRMRFDEGQPIRAIAAALGEDPARVHKEYARARSEFREALVEVVAEQNPSAGRERVRELTERLVGLVG